MSVQTVQRDQIVLDSSANPRATMSEAELTELALSIQARGLLQPVRVRDRGDGTFLLIAGHRRITAIDSLGSAGPTEIDVVVESADVRDSLVDQIVENVQRVDLTPVEEAQGYLRLVQAGFTPQGVAEQVGVALKRVTERLALLELPQAAIDAIDAGTMSTRSAKSVKRLAKASDALVTAAIKLTGKGRSYDEALQKRPDDVAAYLAKEHPKRFLQLPGQITRTAIESIKGSQAVVKLWHDVLDYDDIEPNVAHLSTDAIDTTVAYRGKHRERDFFVFDVERDGELILAAVESMLKERAVAKAAEKRASTDKKLTKSEADKQAERAKRDAELQARKNTHAQNTAFGAKLQLELATATDETRPDMIRAVCHQLIDELNLGKVAQGFALANESWIADKKGEPVYLKTASERTEKAHEWLAGANTPDELLGRVVALLAAAECVAEGSAVSQSARVYPDGLIAAAAKDPLRRLAEPLMPEPLKVALAKRIADGQAQHLDAGEPEGSE